MLPPNAGQILLGGEDITALAPQDRVRRGLARTFQINTLFPHLNALEAVTLAVCRAARHRRPVLAEHRRPQGSDRRGLRHPAQAAARRRLLPADARTALWPPAAAGNRAGARDQAESAAARRAGGRRAAGRKRRYFRSGGRACRTISRCCSSSTTCMSCSASPATSSCWSAARFSREGSPAEIAADPGVREVYLGKRKHG